MEQKTTSTRLDYGIDDMSDTCKGSARRLTAFIKEVEEDLPSVVAAHNDMYDRCFSLLNLTGNLTTPAAKNIAHFKTPNADEHLEVLLAISILRMPQYKTPLGYVDQYTIHKESILSLLMAQYIAINKTLSHLTDHNDGHFQKDCAIISGQLESMSSIRAFFEKYMSPFASFSDNAVLATIMLGIATDIHVTPKDVRPNHMFATLDDAFVDFSHFIANVKPPPTVLARRLIHNNPLPNGVKDIWTLEYLEKVTVNLENDDDEQA